ncbi:hypothetical protein COCVIDRAFT_85820 [Bipolaris victoriae FI3]|uniref:Mitochondrial division protein 1 n=1 Tax=Bipolaris victoriae (strain FI3) TaxID=930091 RepID=W7EYP0_BIPV3|nr:hypothetical protein COCVIDRAFT_85820 [Bipolaris victoriae FI3]
MTSTTSNIAFGNAYSSVQANNINGSVHIEHENILDRLPRAEDAPFNSYARQHEHGCLPDTRVDLLQEIYSWADGQDERCIFWLSGLAGTGKSTVARTVAHSYYTQQRLAASFFFTRGGGDVSHAGMFVTSIAVQLADNIPASRRHIRDAIAERSGIARQSLRDQWQHLILRPLSKLHEAGSYIIVVDALDECDNDSDIQIIVQLLAEVRPSLVGVQLRVLLTSRSEVPIRHGFGQMVDSKHKDVVLHNISPSVVDHDIRIFLEYWLRTMAKDCYYADDWPGAETIGKLVQSAGGLFIWAATAYRFIQQGRPFPDDRLRVVLNDSAVTGCLFKDSSSSEDSYIDDQFEIPPEKRLDSIYLTVLKRPVRRYRKYERKKWYALMKEILGAIILLYSPLSATSLAQLLLISTEEVYRTLDELHSILDVPQRPTYHVRLHHPSFRDFLLNKDRCRDANLWVDKKQAHKALADKCIQLLSRLLKQDICGAGFSNEHMAWMKRKQLEHSILPEIQYACLYWTNHLAESGVQLRDNDKVHEFLKQHFLHWLEALSWMGKVSEGIYAISSLESIALATDCPALYGFIHDMKRFALYNRSPIELAPLQVYSSALLFAPLNSIVKKQFADQLTQWIKSPPQVENDWSACLQTLEGHSGSVILVVFSHDSTRLASVFDDLKATIWDVRSGECLQTFEIYNYSVAFSHDLTRLAFESHENTLKIWDIGSSTDLNTLEGHGNFYLIAFSHGSMQLASASYDGTIKIWDANSCVCLYTSKSHHAELLPAAFSHNLMQLALKSDYETIKIVDTSSGTCLQTFECDCDCVFGIVFSQNFAWLALGASSYTVQIWDIISGACLHTLEGHDEEVKSVAFSHDSTRLASASDDGTIKIWDTSSGLCLQTYEGHSSLIYSVAFSHDSTQLASASQDETIKIWDTNSGVCLQTHEENENPEDNVSSVMLSHDLMQRILETMVCSCLEVDKPSFNKSPYPNGSLAFPHGLTWYASGSSDGTIKIADQESDMRLKTLEGHRDSVELLALSHDSTLLASASRYQTIKIWDTISGRCLQTLEAHVYDSPRSMAFSRDRILLASGLANGEIHIWEINSGALRKMLYGNDYSVEKVAFSDDSMRLASFAVDWTINIWNPNSGMHLQAIKTCDFLSVTEVFALPRSKETVTHQQITNYSMSVSRDCTWILLNGLKWLWLPVEYRPGHFIISDGCITVTTISGRTWGCDFIESF